MTTTRPDPRLQAPPARDRVLRYAQNKRVLAALAIFGVILGLAGPFGTISFIPLPMRLVYWLALTVLLAPLGTLLSLALTDWLIARRLRGGGQRIAQGRVWVANQWGIQCYDAQTKHLWKVLKNPLMKIPPSSCLPILSFSDT